MKRNVRVALIEDDIEDARFLSDSLRQMSRSNIDIELFTCLDEFRRYCVDPKIQSEFNIILADLHLPDSEGLSTVLALQSIKSSIPLIVLSSLDDEEVAIQAVSEGAQDYFNKNSTNVKELIMKMNYAIERQKLINDLNDAKSTIQKHAEFKSRFLAQMSHEIRTPMNGVIGNASLLLRTPLSEEQKEIANAIHNSGDSLIELINDILEISKFESGTLVLKSERFAIRQIVEEVLDSFAYLAAEKGILLSNFVDPSIPKFGVADSNRLKQILHNLVGNALKFTKKGQVEVRASYESKDKKNRLKFEILDTGKGIDPARAHKLFRPFEQSEYKDQFEGTGLGLAICSQLVERMGGRIDVESELGEGSNFFFSIQCPSRDSKPLPRADLNGLTFNIVSSNHRLCGVIENLCRARGIEYAQLEEIPDLDPVHLKGDFLALDFLDKEPGYIQFWLEKFKADPSHKSIRVIIFSADRPTGIEELSNVKHVGHVVRQSHFYRSLAELVEYRDLTAMKVKNDFKIFEPKGNDRSNGKNILIVDDVVANLKIVESMLAILGHRSSSAESGYDALSFCETDKFDLILMDCQMPGIDGFEAAHMIKNGNTPNVSVPIVALTADVLVAKDIIESSFDGYLPKPVRLEDIEKLLKDVFSKKGKKNMNPVKKSRMNPELNTDTLGMLRDLGEGNRDSSFLDGLIDTFRAETPQIIIEMREAVKDGKNSAIKHLAHKLKGFSRNLGVEGLANECEILEHNNETMSLSEQNEKMVQITEAHKLGVEDLQRDWHSEDKVG